MKRLFAKPSWWLAAILAPLPAATSAQDLEREIGRSEVRVRSAPFRLVEGRSVWGLALAQRLERLGYRRLRRRPETPGELFWGNEVFWIYRRPHRLGGTDHPALLFGLELAHDGVVTGFRHPQGAEPPPQELLRLEPELLSESLAGDRARRRPISFDALPEHAWRAVLAAEDARFFEHTGVDARSLARALLANVRAGSVTQGGSTITQQLIKNRDLTPKRTLGRKASEAVRALALELEHPKEEILQAYLNQVYLGHVDGLAIHGIGTAAHAYFSVDATRLDLAQSALLAAIIQGPNRMAPQRHPERARKRRDWVLSRLEELGWATPAAAAAAKRRPVALRPGRPEPPPASHFLSWVAAIAREETPKRLAEGRGVVVETTLDPWLQARAEEAVADWLADLRRRHRSLRDAPLAAALVALDADSGAVLAYVGGDPAAPRAGFDRARQARRQPGSAVKPLLLLEAFESCGRRAPLYPAARVADEPLELELPSGPWRPTNADDRFRGVVDVRRALVASLNVPFVRIGRWCGFEATARRLRRAGLSLPEEPPPAFTLGAVETSPVELARAYTALAGLGNAAEARPIRRIEKPEGARLARFKPRRRKVSRPETAYLVHDLLLDAARRGTAGAAAVEGLAVAAKTGTTSERRDAWLAGYAGSVVAVVWVGRDDNQPLGLTGTAAAAPLWKRFMEHAVPARPPRPRPRPEGVMTLYVDSKTGLLVREANPRAHPELFRRGALPRRDRFWRYDRDLPVIR